MTRKIDLTKSPEEHCPRFDFCSKNKCPLSYDYAKLQNDSSDPSEIKKEKCICKNIRRDIAQHFPKLLNKGLTSREFSASQNWEKMTSEQQANKILKLQQNSPICRLSMKGYSISRKKPFSSDLHEQNAQLPLFSTEKTTITGGEAME